jgi:predicted transposase YbfD/YdcC
LAEALLDDLDLRCGTVTGDAQFCQRKLSQRVVTRGGAYFWAVKDNQHHLLDALVTLFRLEPPPGETFAIASQRGRRGDRQEERTLRASTILNAYLDWPHLGQVCTVERVITRKGRTTHETAYAITSLTPQQANAARLATIWRGHWGIENRLHWVRDVTFDEDRSQIRTGNGPQVVAALRNTVIGILRRAGHTNIAAALRTYAARPLEVLALAGLI